VDPRPTVRPIVVLSQCLEQEACRYNAQMVRDDFVREIESFVEFRATCPEVEVGLGVPRDPIRLVRIGESPRLIQPTTGLDVTDAMEKFATRFLDGLGPVDGFILKNRSPSCGIKDVKVYAAAGNSPSVGTGPGVFARAVLERYGDVAVEDEGRLRNPRIRHHFLTRLFTLARFRQAIARTTGRAHRRRSIAPLVEFHATHKLMFMAYNQTTMREMGRLVGNAGRGMAEEVFAGYREGLGRLLAHPARTGSWVNVAEHAFGYFSDALSSRERKFFATLVSDYREERQPLQAVLSVLGGWVARFDTQYLAGQTFFEPYPPELLALEHR
jgi:uncharacterized protein YbgA (DUF1722 family)/uncharacterized protein YbbK (DUF523 family)